MNSDSVSMMVLANVPEHRGRSLYGLELVDGKPSCRYGEPRVLQPRLKQERRSIPLGLVVDLRPYDVVEFVVQGPPDAAGVTLLDPYSIRIRGQLRSEDLHPLYQHAPLTTGSTAGVEGLSMVWACGLSLSWDEGRGGTGRTGLLLSFGCDGERLQWPLDDPEWNHSCREFGLGRELPSCCGLLLQGGRSRLGAGSQGRVLAILD